ncbi:MAG: cation:proton antiporter, partial [Hyphomicrobiaceae bacterium]
MAAEFQLAPYKDALIMLGTAGVVVPLAQRFKISPILAFLLAGAVLGPKGIGTLAGSVPGIQWIAVSHQEDVAKIAEFGVVFLLFLIGLELPLPRLMTMRRLVFGLGGLQVVLSACLIGGAVWWLGSLPAPGALAIGAALSLSSTAIVVEVLARQHRLSSMTGRTGFAVLLFQDLAVVPIMFLVGNLGGQTGGSIVPGLLSALVQGAAAVALIVLAGRLLLRPLFRMVALTDGHELFIAATLFVAIGTSLATAAAGLSMALGAFVAGLLLAETEFRRAVEATIEPFKNLLLGMFFFWVGMSLDVRALLSDPFWLVAVAAGLIALKAVLLAGLVRLARQSWPVAVETGLLLGPAGEFAFVIIGLAMTYGLVTSAVGGAALTVASLTMALIPACAVLGRRLAR